MLGYTVFFLIIALTAGAVGFGIIAVPTATIAKVFFLIFLVLSVFSLVRRSKPTA
jgi:uncharacterized membrane protein YtjA (UPF0391 family)